MYKGNDLTNIEASLKESVAADKAARVAKLTPQGAGDADANADGKAKISA
jgi:hypothetical protein